MKWCRRKVSEEESNKTAVPQYEEHARRAAVNEEVREVSAEVRRREALLDDRVPVMEWTTSLKRGAVWRVSVTTTAETQ